MKTHLIFLFLFTLVLSASFNSYAGSKEDNGYIVHYNQEDPNVSQPLPEKDETEANPVVPGENCNCKKNASPVGRFADTDARKIPVNQNKDTESSSKSGKGVND